jgi:hypothetical protein
MLTVLKLTVELFEGEAMVTLGGVLSSLMLTDVLATLPALSMAVPETDWLTPSVVTVCGGGQVATPEDESVQLNVTVGLLLFQPAAFGTGDTTAVIAGDVWSTLTVTEVLAVFPATSVAVPEMT